ncbi:heavy-metal-associated domain-containing protein [Halomonas ramblicola]|uniref:heavy-metal-associated domain-containing protein n=1 Tax=Halomonas ramblicola TaxID=747349 RepID=UPI0025B4D754|nr:heavy-metal-associated domain-containing protein [Halomonas ramblicola]MDN3520471.1 heavy-metal-associated domain-containing protein [Halomonas ramblicola]
MMKLKVPKMTCGHCASTVTTAIKTVDADANVEIDLAEQQVTIESHADADTLAAVLVEAGYPNESV